METKNGRSSVLLKAMKWSALAELSSRVVTPLTFLVLARLLSPTDFGVVAAATVVISFSQVLSDAGIPKALIQRQSQGGGAATAAFWISLAAGLVIALVLLIAAPALAELFDSAGVAPVIRILTLQILLSAFSATHVALLQREMQFKTLFWIRLSSALVPAITAIPAAIHGLGYWALIIGTLAGQAFQAVILWRSSPWRPTLSLDLREASALLSFGRWTLLTGILIWFYAWMDTLIVGHYLGTHDMGLYRTGNTFVTLIFGTLFAPVLPVLYSQFARSQAEAASLAPLLLRVSRLFMLAAAPISCFLLVAAEDISQLLFGEQWLGIGAVIGMLGVMHGASWLVGANGEVYRAIAKPEVETWVNLAMLMPYLIVYLMAVREGLDTFLLARVGLMAVAIAAHILVARKILGIAFQAWYSAPTLLVPVASALIVAPLELGVTSSLLDVALRGSIFGVLWLLGSYLVNKPLLLEATGILGAAGKR